MEATKKACLEALGVNLEITLPRFLDNEVFYLRMLDKFLRKPYLEDLSKEIESEDYEEAFRACHSLKGVSVNLGLDKLYEMTLPLTEELRNPPYDRKRIGEYLTPLKESYVENVETIKKVLG